MGRTVTYFQDYKAINPFYLSIDQSLERIRSGVIKDKIEHLRSIDDLKRARIYKTETLPCILFSGKFSTRKDNGILEHSGFCILDFDHINPLKYKQELKKFPWIYAMFVSPSGDGLKVVARIRANIGSHRDMFLAIKRELSGFDGFDKTSINISRVCFESWDADIYINAGAIEFTPTISGLLERAIKMIRDSPDGGKHAELLKAAKLCGGWVASGQVDEGDARYALERAIEDRGADNMDGARKTIRDGINYGKSEPIVEVNYRSNGVGEVSKPVIIDDHVSTRSNESEYMGQVRTQTLPMGLSTGFEKFDLHFRFKPSNFVIINGHDNVGKSTFIWFMAVLSNVLHGWKWIMYCAENTEGQVRKSLMQFKTGKAIHNMSEKEYSDALDWAYDNFTLIKVQEMLSWKDLLKVGVGINSKKHHHGFLIDPYNALDLDLNSSPLSSHEYHYMVTSQMRSFCKHWNTSIYLNCHAVTEALRRTHKDGLYMGFPAAPNKADTEGGGKFSNRADEFLTIHRYVQHPTEYNVTQVHVRKVKETETGGRPTMLDEPVLFKMEKGYYGFFDVDTLVSPLVSRVHTTREMNHWTQERGDAPF
jgi:hypothetical protein